MKKILVAEDDDQIRLLLAKFLSRICDVMLCPNAKEAIHLIESGEFKPDIILTDYDCPDTASGGRVIAAAHKHLPTATLIIMTGGAHDEEVLRQMHKIDEYLHKPFQLEQLLEILTRHMPLPF